MKNVFITGANRGIGLELVKQCLDMKYEVVATHRKNSDINNLSSLSEENPNLTVMELDVNSCSSVNSLFSRLNASKTKIDLLFNNAGILDWSPMEKIQIDSMQQIYETNVIGALRVIKESTDCLKRSQDPLIVNLSSRLGSISLRGETQLGGAIAYQCSKAALNMLTKQASIDLSIHEIRVISMSPGWVRTEMGGEDAKYSVNQSVSLFLDKIEALDSTQTGIFLGEDGMPIPW